MTNYSYHCYSANNCRLNQILKMLIMPPPPIHTPSPSCPDHFLCDFFFFVCVYLRHRTLHWCLKFHTVVCHFYSWVASRLLKEQNVLMSVQPLSIYIDGGIMVALILSHCCWVFRCCCVYTRHKYVPAYSSKLWHSEAAEAGHVDDMRLKAICVHLYSMIILRYLCSSRWFIQISPLCFERTIMGS